MGSMYIEMATLKVGNNSLKGRWWKALNEEGGIATSGTLESFLSATNVAEARVLHKVIACRLYQLKKGEAETSDESRSFND